MLDVNELADNHGKPHPFMSIGAIAVSPNGKRLAYTTDTTGYRQYTLHVLDLTTRELLPDTDQRVGSLAWAPDSETLFYTTEDDQTKRQDRVFRHVLGTSPVEGFS